MWLQVLHKVNTTGHTDNYYEPLDDKETDNDVDESNHSAFTVTKTTTLPNITFSLTIQIQTFDPECTTLRDSPDSCEGVRIDPGHLGLTKVTRKSPPRIPRDSA
jgi:hypothetical protein